MATAVWSNDRFGAAVASATFWAHAQKLQIMSVQGGDGAVAPALKKQPTTL